jgi:hypothetical protein
MKAQDFIDYYLQESGKIPEKFEKIKEITKEWLFFDRKELIKKDYSPFESIKYFDRNFTFTLEAVDKDEIEIIWYDRDGDYYCVYVSSLFFDDFDSYLEYVKNLVSENNKRETKKYEEYIKQQEKQLQEENEKEYKEYLRLKEKFENV